MTTFYRVTQLRDRVDAVDMEDYYATKLEAQKALLKQLDERIEETENRLDELHTFRRRVEANIDRQEAGGTDG